MVGAKGFEPSTSWSRTSKQISLSRCPGVTYGISSPRSDGQVGQVNGHKSDFGPTQSMTSPEAVKRTAAGGRSKSLPFGVHANLAMVFEIMAMNSKAFSHAAT